jgi:hypothetical protein
MLEKEVLSATEACNALGIINSLSKVVVVAQETFLKKAIEVVGLDLKEAALATDMLLAKSGNF